MAEIHKVIISSMVLDIVAMAIIVIFPQIALFLSAIAKS